MGTNGVGKTSLMQGNLGQSSALGRRGDAGRRSARGAARQCAGAHRAWAMCRRGAKFSRCSACAKTWKPGSAACRAPNTHPRRHLRAVPGAARDANRRGGDLSGGQQQQLAIARALITRPKLLLAGRADRRHPAQHHPADWPRDRHAAGSRRHGNHLGRAVFRLCLRHGGPLRCAAPWGSHVSRRQRKPLAVRSDGGGFGLIAVSQLRKLGKSFGSPRYGYGCQV